MVNGIIPGMIYGIICSNNKVVSGWHLLLKQAKDLVSLVTVSSGIFGAAVVGLLPHNSWVDNARQNTSIGKNTSATRTSSLINDLIR